MNVMDKYFSEIDSKLILAYDLATKAREKGYDPETKVETPLAKNLAERVEGLISAVAPQIKGSGVVERIAELEKEFKSQDWRVALKIAEEVAKEKFCKFKDIREAMEVGIRTGFAYITVGVVASPLEGFVELKLKNRLDNGKEYFCLMYSGPIRSAGGTAGAVSVIIADYIRKKMGYAEYDPTEEESKRAFTELEDYHERVTNLQYHPTEEEVSFIMSKLPVQIDGDGSEKYEVSNYKDLKRVQSRIIRNGICLVLAECILQKASKLSKQISKWGNDFDLRHWNFLNELVQLQTKIKAKGKIDSEVELKLAPNYIFINDLVAGRPVLTHPLAKGGFRLRYGRCRNSGFSNDSIHPATMAVLNSYIAIGTQLKVERPGKAATVSSCDNIEGPIVKLKNGNVIFLETIEDAKKNLDKIKEILFLGDILINYGDFLNRNHKLVPCGYNEEWYSAELKKVVQEVKEEVVEKILKDKYTKISASESINLAKKYNIPLHPRYTYHWNELSKENFPGFLQWLKNAVIEDNKIIIPIIEDDKNKRTLELIGIPHTNIPNEYIVIEKDDAVAFEASLNLRKIKEENLNLEFFENEEVLSFVNRLSGIKIRDKSGTFIGARMGRPEKAKMRKLTGSPQVLFPVGKEGGKMRNVQAALDKSKVVADFPIRYCDSCKKNTIYFVCEDCFKKTTQKYFCMKCNKECNSTCDKHHEGLTFKKQEIDINHYFSKALKKLGIREYKELIKGVRGTTNKESIPENLAKGILRSKYNLYVNKDGTIRYDMTEMPITHFKPKEIGTSVDKLIELGYIEDIFENPLKDENQILELRPQDIILPNCKESPDETSGDVLVKIAWFIDELLIRFYGLDSFYNLKNEKDLIGHLVVGLSPHTSAGIVARIIGFSSTQGFLAHPLFHSIMRRDCDGDEACVILLLDALINFSRKFLPAHRGTTQDAPLVLTSKLIPNEVDDMVFDLDIAWEYPIELYEAALEYKAPSEVKIPRFFDLLGTEKQYFGGIGFTHDVSSINLGVTCSAYKSIPTMMDKIKGQMDIAEKVRAVDEVDVARLVIEKHLIRDIKGNLRKFSTQEFRCVDCNEKYRRPPLIGRCSKCDGKLIFTVAQGSIVKYLEPTLQLAAKYNVPSYLKQTIMLTKNRIEGVFGKEKEKQEGLVKWFI